MKSYVTMSETPYRSNLEMKSGLEKSLVKEEMAAKCFVTHPLNRIKFLRSSVGLEPLDTHRGPA
jgi:hypothetical protein